MDSRGLRRHDSDHTQVARQGQARGSTRSIKSSDQRQQLPSLREAILPSLHTAIESAADSPVSNRLPQLQNPGQPFIGRPPGSNLSSPIYSQSSSMPDSFEELGQKNYESVHQFPAQRPSLNWSAPTDYPDMATTYAQRPPFYHPTMAPLKQEPGLPSIRDMTFASPTMPSPSYNNVFGGSPQGAMPMDYGQPYRRPSYNDGRSLSQTYPPYSRPYTMDKYSQSYAYSDYNRMSQPYNDYTNSYVNSGSHGGYHSVDHDGRNKKRRGNLPKPVTEILKAWLLAHLEHPYPTDDEKSELGTRTGLTQPQISNWFINARRRHYPAMKEKAVQQGKLKQDPDRMMGR